MSSLMGGTLDSTIDLMSEMTKLTRILISRVNLGEVQDELVMRANEMNGEMENICVLLKKDCILLDDLNNKSQVEKMKFQDELQQVKKERDDLREKLTRLEEDERIVSERVKRAEERFAKDCEEQSHMTNAKSKIISELNIKVTKLNNQVLEKDQMLNKCREKLKSMEVKVLQREQEVHDLKHQKSAAYQIIEEKLKNQVLERDQMLNTCKEELKFIEVKVVQKEQELHDLKHQKLAAYQISEEKLKNQVLERDQMLNTCEEKLKFMEVKVLQREQEVHDLKQQKLAAYQTIEELMHKQAEADQRTEELRCQNVEASQNTEKLKQLLLAVERDKLKTDEELKDIREKQLEVDKNMEELRRKNLVALRAVEEFKEWTLAADESFEENKERWEVFPRIKTVEEGLIRVLKIKVLDLANSVLKEAVDANSPISKGGRESLRTWTRINEGGVNGDDSLDQTCSQFNSSPPQVETSSGTDLEKGTEKSHCSDTVEVANRDDEAKSAGESEYNSDLQVSLVDFSPRRKRSSLGNSVGDLPNKRQKKGLAQEPSQENDKSLGIKSKTPNPVLRRCEEKAGAASDSQTQIWISSSDSDDESCSDSDMDDMVRSVRFENIRKTWKSESDMLKDFQKDVELCMDAVCVLYRRKIRESEPPACSGVEVSHFDVMGGCSLAEYLINGDPDCRLRKFVPQVEEERPDGLVQCRKIATDYCEKLFSIYCNGDDPFFKS